ncbi:phosphoglycerate dehydrogenase [Cupriavidus pauculus]|uniref:Phosphoglycerate dehydrogenase n=2 Tax=Cupriavidus pauculus TaxID=82633 RepID=A0A2N5C6Z5_9BURK|nr:phosphoglycerate dehydrogenase [Cupriavidus pauculus]
MPVCLITQPIHPVGAERMRAAGIDVRHSTASNEAERIAEVRDVDAVIVREGLSAAVIDAAPRLALISNHGTGTDKIAVTHAHACGIPVVSTPAANVRAVAEHAMMLMLAVARNAVLADAATRRSDWQHRYTVPMHSLSGKTLGIVGFGRTGQIVAQMASAGFGMRVVVWSPRVNEAEVVAQRAERVPTLQALLEMSDVVSLHRPLRPDTRHTIDAAALAVMKPGAILINTSRGGLIDEPALVDALRNSRLFGAGLDVFEREPLPVASALAALPNVVLSPHQAGSTQEALAATASQCATQIIDVLAGRQPEHMLDPSVWLRRRHATTEHTTETPA